MKERTEEDKIVQAGIDVILGGKTYSIRPLVIRDSREWRKEAIKLIAPLPKLASAKIEDAEEFGQILTTMLVTSPDQAIDLFFMYAKDLDRDVIENEATDDEMATAFKAVLEIAFPLATMAPATLEHITKGAQ